MSPIKRALLFADGCKDLVIAGFYYGKAMVLRLAIRLLNKLEERFRP